MPSYQLYVVPQRLWPRAAGDAADSPTNGSDDAAASPLRQLLRECSDLWRRIHKGTNAEVERARFQVCAGEVEAWLLRHAPTIASDASALAAAAARGKIASIPIHPRYFDVMARAHLDRQSQLTSLSNGQGLENKVVPPPSLGCSIFPPETIAGQLAACEAIASAAVLDAAGIAAVEGRIAALRAAAAHHSGVVELAEELDNGEVLPPVPRPEVSPAKVDDAAPTENFNSEEAPPVGKRKRQQMAERLTAEILTALKANGKVNMSNQPHEVTTDVLGALIRCQPGQAIAAERATIRVIYADGSEAKPFPLYCRPPAQAAAPASAVMISAALMSMRHLELDPFVDFAWYRNKEVSQTRALAESDNFCFQYSTRLLAELRASYADTPVVLNMYHTGFEPAAIGFYRALVLALAGEQRWLRVVPHYFRGGSRFDASVIVWD